MSKPLCIDIYSGLGGWSEGFLAEGYECVGFDIERHVYDDQRYPGQLVLQDALTLHGKQFRDAAVIVASPPCQEYSYMALPWSRGKQIAAALRGQGSFPDGYTGSRTIPQLTALFAACFRIQREACEAAGRHIPMVVENVKGAQPWVGKARANFGSFYFWGDVAMVGGQVVAGRPQFGETVKAPRRPMKHNPDGTEHPQGSWFAIADSKERGAKVPGISFSGYGEPGYKAQGFNVTAAQRYRERGNPGGSFQTAAVNGVKLGPDCDGSARKAASAQIAKIPFPLSSYIARAFRP